MSLGGNNKNSDESILPFDKPIFLFLDSFIWRKLNWVSFPFFITEWFDLDTSGKTTS